MQDNPGDIRQRLNIVNKSRLAVKATLRGIWRSRSHVGSATLDRIKQRGFFATDIAAFTHDELNIERQRSIQDLSSQEILVPSLTKRLFK
jgi:hypothetical protein